MCAENLPGCRPCVGTMEIHGPKMPCRFDLTDLFGINPLFSLSLPLDLQFAILHELLCSLRDDVVIAEPKVVPKPKHQP